MMKKSIHTNFVRSIKMLGFLCSLFTLNSTRLSAQTTGYIYVHSKVLNESDSPLISYSVSGGPTSVPGFALNDNPTQTILDDVGASQNGRLWAVSNTHVLYYRDPLTSNWIKTGITDVFRVDGGPTNTCFYLDMAGTIFSYTGLGAATQISAAGQFSSSSADIGSGWTSTPYVVNDAADVYKYSGSGTSWNTYSTVTGNNLYKIDVNPKNGNVYIGGSNGSVRTIRQIAPDLSVTSLGSPVADFTSYRDLAVNENGEVYASAYDNVNAAPGWYVHKFLSGTTWVREASSFDGANITGGVANSLWLTMNSGGWSGGNGWTPAAGPYPFYNIFSRGFDGSVVTYIDDERVRTAPTAGNSELIPVAPGTYTITETVPGSWDLQKITVYDPSANSSSNLSAGTATVSVTADEVVHVVFQTGQINTFNMTTDCANAYLETFGTGTVGSYGLPVTGQTTYHYLTGNAPGEDGYYKIVNRANPDFNTWSSAAGITDHTPGDGALGYMYAVNAGYDRGEFFRRRFTGVIPGATYNFSAWLVDLTPSNTVNVSFQVLDHTTKAVLGSYNTGALPNNGTPDSWRKFGFSFNATAPDIDLVIGNIGFGGNGNDLAIDDISFSLSPPIPTVVIQSGSCVTGLGSITVTSPLSSNYEYSVNGSSWQSTPVFNNLAVGTYTVYVRFTGTTNCTNSTTSAAINPSICGNVFHDSNGLADNQVNGIPINVAGPSALYVSLYNGTALVSTLPVNADGSYSFPGVSPNTTYSIILGTNSAANTSSSFQGSGNSGWVDTGEDCCDNIGGDGNTNGVLSIVLGTASLNNANFGIEHQPDSDPKTTVITQPTLNQLLTLNGGTNPPVLSGSDLEDLPTGGVLSTKSVKITSVPANAELYYNNALVTAGTTIPNFDPSKLQIKFISASLGSTSTQFQYAYVDAAGVADPTPATYVLNWDKPLPVTLVSFDVKGFEAHVQLNWTTSAETNSSYFGIERSTDARTWNEIGQLPAATNASALSKYYFTDKAPAAGTNYYRLKMTDLDESFAYSKIRSVSLEAVSIRLYPNPVAAQLNIDNIGFEQIQKISVYNQSGLAVYTNEGIIKPSINMSNLAIGTYVVTITLKDGTRFSKTILKN